MKKWISTRDRLPRPNEVVEVLQYGCSGLDKWKTHLARINERQWQPVARSMIGYDVIEMEGTEHITHWRKQP
jgi:hypothetical protein